MKIEEAKQLRESWGDNPCEHPSIEKEYFLGADTGDKVCTQCGRIVEYMGGGKIQPDKKEDK